MNWIIALIHMMFYAFVIASFTIVSGKLPYTILPKMKLNTLSLKADSAELAMESEACESYLDQHSMGLVYCFE